MGADVQQLCCRMSDLAGSEYSGVGDKWGGPLKSA